MSVASWVEINFSGPLFFYVKRYFFNKNLLWEDYSIIYLPKNSCGNYLHIWWDELKLKDHQGFDRFDTSIYRHFVSTNSHRFHVLMVYWHILLRELWWLTAPPCQPTDGCRSTSFTLGSAHVKIMIKNKYFTFRYFIIP